MQSITYGAADAIDRAILIEGQDSTGGAVNLSSATFFIGGTILADTTCTASVTQMASSVVHRVILTQAQTSLYSVGEIGYIRIPTGTSALAVSFPFLVTESQIADAPPTVTNIRDALLNWEPYTGINLARTLRVLGIVLRGTKSGSNTATEVFTAPAGGATVTATVDSDGNRSVVSDTASGTP